MNPYGQVAGVTSEDQNAFGQTGDQTAVDQGTSAGTQSDGSGITYVGPSPDNFTVAQAFGFFNILVGLMLVAGLLLFFGGFIAYLTRLGLESRIEGLTYMYWGLTILFVLIVLLAIVHYLQFHPTVVFGILAVVVVCFIAWAAIQVSQSGGDDEH